MTRSTPDPNRGTRQRRRHHQHRALRRTLTTALLAVLPLAVGTLTVTTAHADPTAATWARLRDCESGDNYTIVADNGHYGAYQFDLATWRSVGGTGRPNQAGRAEQDFRALYLYRMRGWQPWTCARKLHLPADHDAASGRAPTRAQAAAISGTHTTTQTTAAAMPAWPGKVYAYGDCAPALRTWQLRMNTYHRHFQGTGCYYGKTRAAVLAVQRANGIRTSGRLGPQTWRAAWLGAPPQT